MHKAKDCKSKFNGNGGQNGGNHMDFQKIRLLALTALIVVDQDILRVIVSNQGINLTVTG
jgi:hypothetical protein